jgi:N-acetylmuramoyl-L-alanine amidase
MRPKYFGAQVFYGPQMEDSERFGKIMQDRMINMLNPENTRQSKKCTDSVYLIYHAPMPALLIECGFYRIRRRNACSTQKNISKRLAFAIFCGTMDYFGLEYQGKDDNASSREQEI